MCQKFGQFCIGGKYTKKKVITRKKYFKNNLVSNTLLDKMKKKNIFLGQNFFIADVYDSNILEYVGRGGHCKD
jgi:hypothetical protein